ncbi:hypothetical protein pipiens_015964 [Culex pipiens pipiens]|uniref:PNT domain-containing protein n=3 Tax=Culex pipiens TaxID=7175 RepID=A0ABD1CN82_CULPP
MEGLHETPEAIISLFSRDIRERRRRANSSLEQGSVKQSKANQQGKNICPRKRKHRSTPPEKSQSASVANTQSKIPAKIKTTMQVESATKWRVPPLDLSAVSVLANESDRRWAHAHGLHHHHHHSQSHHQAVPTTMVTPPTAVPSKKIHYGADGLPIDPRDWTRANVWTWLINLAQSEGLDISPELAQKFPMNGKALCLMSLDMYLSRVPVGGKMLYRDFRVRLARAMSL